MKNAILIVLPLALCLGIAAGCTGKNSTSPQAMKNSDVSAQLKSFVAEKAAQAKVNSPDTPQEVKAFFAAAQQGDWIGVSNSFAAMRVHAPQYEHTGTNDMRLRGTPWQTVMETWGTFDAVFEGGDKYAALYADEIIKSIPPGSIYFGGTDPGRFLITGMEKSQVNGDPFYTVTQNALADSTYLAYLRQMYGGRIYVPTDKDVQKCFVDYMADAQKREQDGKLKPGEDVFTDADGKVQVSGEVSVMEINGLIAKVIFDQNSSQQFYVEESFPLDWMYPYLEPNGIIMKLNRQPLPELSDAIVQRDEDYWSGLMAPMIGDWLKPGTSLDDVTNFATKVYVNHDLSGFTGDEDFVRDEFFQKAFSKERSAIAGLYAWRAGQATDPAEKKRMEDAADFAFRQALVLCPYSPEVVFRYVNLLMSEGRRASALQLAETAAQMPQLQGKNGAAVRSLVKTLQRIRR